MFIYVYIILRWKEICYELLNSFNYKQWICQPFIHPGWSTCLRGSHSDSIKSVHSVFLSLWPSLCGLLLPQNLCTISTQDLRVCCQIIKFTIIYLCLFAWVFWVLFDPKLKRETPWAWNDVLGGDVPINVSVCLLKYVFIWSVDLQVTPFDLETIFSLNQFCSLL